MPKKCLQYNFSIAQFEDEEESLAFIENKF